MCWLYCSSVHQTPADIYTKGEDVKINCSQSIQNYDTILWYKQSAKLLQFLGYMYLNNYNPEPGVNVSMDGNADKGKNGTLIIKEPKVSSSGVYFCAAYYHSAARHYTSIQKRNKPKFFLFL
uniref:Ig-like domain-containing protein n=1 Tax=Pundamilia nyererei TaxID=303518 RepID=A0A3B4FWV2_9CICH